MRASGWRRLPPRRGASGARQRASRWAWPERPSARPSCGPPRAPSASRSHHSPPAPLGASARGGARRGPCASTTARALGPGMRRATSAPSRLSCTSTTRTRTRRASPSVRATTRTSTSPRCGSRRSSRWTMPSSARPSCGAWRRRPGSSAAAPRTSPRTAPRRA